MGLNERFTNGARGLKSLQDSVKCRFNAARENIPLEALQISTALMGAYCLLPPPTILAAALINEHVQQKPVVGATIAAVSLLGLISLGVFAEDKALKKYKYCTSLWTNMFYQLFHDRKTALAASIIMSTITDGMSVALIGSTCAGLTDPQLLLSYMLAKQAIAGSFNTLTNFALVQGNIDPLMDRITKANSIVGECMKNVGTSIHQRIRHK
ncbi:MAG: hypothetical protein V1922_00355 [bacterium]